jgi:predicted aminopeptidase
VVGRLEYRGYYSEAAARRYAAKLERKGFDAYVEGVEAYSTLGWFRDPVLNTFIERRKPELAEILFHELAHQRVFAPGDTDFNEAFATAVAEEGVVRWLRAAGDPAESGNYQIGLQRNAQFVRLIMATRGALEVAYGADRSGGGSSSKNLSDQERSRKRSQKADAIERLREDYERLKGQWGGYTGYDDWFAHSLNNAQLNTVATYYHWVPAFRRILERSGGDLDQFYKEVKGLAKLAKEERHRRLNRLLE